MQQARHGAVSVVLRLYSGYMWRKRWRHAAVDVKFCQGGQEEFPLRQIKEDRADSGNTKTLQEALASGGESCNIGGVIEPNIAFWEARFGGFSF